MSKHVDNGGPAYPGPAQHEQRVDIHEGMKLRDYFAAMALPMVMHNYCEADERHAAHIAQVAYKWAEAMIEARKDGGA